MIPYLELTREFNRGGLRVIVSGGPAAVLLRLSISSKDGDWILRETPEALAHVREVLASHGATYRFGAPLDVRWMAGGWSAHLEFDQAGYRVRTDFVTRPPRLSAEDLEGLWKQQGAHEWPSVDPRRLIALKQTGRERDYAVIGELARLVEAPADQLLVSRSAEDLVVLAANDPALARRLASSRPLLALAVASDRTGLEQALDAERRTLMAADVARLDRYRKAASRWAAGWPRLQQDIAGLPLPEQHERLVAAAMDALPFAPEVP